MAQILFTLIHLILFGNTESVNYHEFHAILQFWCCPPLPSWPGDPDCIVSQDDEGHTPQGSQRVHPHREHRAPASLLRGDQWQPQQ